MVLQAFLNRLHYEASAASLPSHHHNLADPHDSMDMTNPHIYAATLGHHNNNLPSAKPLDLNNSTATSGGYSVHHANVTIPARQAQDKSQQPLVEPLDSMDVTNPHAPPTADITCEKRILPFDKLLELNVSMTESHSHSMPDAATAMPASRTQRNASMTENHGDSMPDETTAMLASAAQAKSQQLLAKPTDSMHASHHHICHDATGDPSQRQLQRSSNLANDGTWSPEAQQDSVKQLQMHQAASGECSSVSDQTTHLGHLRQQSPPFQPSMQEQAVRPHQLQTARCFSTVEQVGMGGQLAEPEGQSETVQLPSSEAQMLSVEDEAPATAAATADVTQPFGLQMQTTRQIQTAAAERTAGYTAERTAGWPNGRLSLEWLRAAPPEVASAFLMSVEGTFDSMLLP